MPTQVLTFRQYLLIYGIPLSVILVGIGLALSPLIVTSPELIMGIAYDLTLTAPIAYLILIWNKKIPRITVAPIFILGLGLATFLLPENQHVQGITTWLFPIVELAIMSTIGYQVIQFRKKYRYQASTDFLSTFRHVAKEVTGNARIANVMATEAAVFHYAFFNWRKSKVADNAFTYHQKSGTNGLIWGLIMVILVETIALHFLVASWSVLFAWVVTGSSIYLAVQLFAHLKSLAKRPILIEKNHLSIKYGLFADATISFEEIERVEVFKQEVTGDGIKKIALLGDAEAHNIRLILKKEVPVIGVYGLTKSYHTLLFFVDDQQGFINQLTSKL